MGIKGLNKIISLYANKSVSVQHISNFTNKKIAIDSEILIYQYRTNGDSNSHIHGFINNVFWYLKNGITPVYVFDGAPSVSKKNNVISKRYSVKEKIYQKAEEIEIKLFEKLDNSNDEFKILDKETNSILDDLYKVQKKIISFNVNRGHRHECKYLLKLMGIPYINASEDAEAMCVSLYYNSLVDYIYTEDTDAIVYSIAYKDKKIGYPKILRKNYIPNMITVIDVEKIINQLEMSADEFIDFSIMSGCDFSVNIPKIGPIKSYFYIKKYKTIENFKESGVVEFPEKFDYEEARNMFSKNYDQIIEKELNVGIPDIEHLKEYLINERNIYPYQIIEKLEYLKNAHGIFICDSYESNIYSSSSFDETKDLDSFNKGSCINNLVLGTFDDDLDDDDLDDDDFINIG